MGRIISRLKKKREEGKIYYIAYDVDGTLLLGEADMRRGKGSKPRRRKE